jgi:hypothetical protein
MNKSLVTALVAAALALTTFACGSAAGSPDTCEGACSHYLSCKGSGTSESHVQCTKSCEAMNLDAKTLQSFSESTCSDAIAAVEGNGGSMGGGGQGGGGGAGGGGGGSAPDCTNCQHDGTSCIWLSPSTGLHSACDPSCC